MIPYHNMLPSFKEAVNIVTCEDNIQGFHQSMSKLIANWKSKHSTEMINPNYNYISSNINGETATKYHGCDGYKRKGFNLIL